MVEHLAEGQLSEVGLSLNRLDPAGKDRLGPYSRHWRRGFYRKPYM